MRNLLRLLFLGVLAVVSGGAGCASARDAAPRSLTAVPPPVDRRALALQVVESWSTPAALAARRLIDQYGAPDEVRTSRLLWIRNGPWKRTLVTDVAGAYVGTGRENVVEQTVECPLTPSQAAALAAFSEDLAVDRETGELTARSEREESNFLKINLAMDVAQQRKTTTQAQAYFKKVLGLEAAGKSSPYIAGLLFAFGK